MPLFRLRATLVAALIATSAIARTVAAEPAPAATTRAAPAVPATAASSPATPALPAHRSALERYRRHADAPVTPWRESNDTVGRIGGWKAYAREAQAAERAASAP